MLGTGPPGAWSLEPLPLWGPASPDTPPPFSSLLPPRPGSLSSASPRRAPAQGGGSGQHTSWAETPQASPVGQRRPGRRLASGEGTEGQGRREPLAPAGDGGWPRKLRPGWSVHLGGLDAVRPHRLRHTCRQSGARARDAVGSLSVCGLPAASPSPEKGLSLTGELGASARRVCSRPGWSEGMRPGLFKKKMQLPCVARPQADKTCFFQRQGGVSLTLEPLAWLTHTAESLRPAEPERRPAVSRSRRPAEPGPCGAWSPPGEAPPRAAERRAEGLRFVSPAGLVASQRTEIEWKTLAHFPKLI